MLYREYAAPAFKLGAPYISLRTLAITIAPAHIASGSKVTASVVFSSLQLLEFVLPLGEQVFQHELLDYFRVLCGYGLHKSTYC